MGLDIVLGSPTAYKDQLPSPSAGTPPPQSALETGGTGSEAGAQSIQTLTHREKKGQGLC